MTNLDAALSLAAQGLPVFPCQTDGDKRKTPMPGVMWRSAATTDPARIAHLWAGDEDPAPGVDLAHSPYFVVDCDAPKVSGGVHGIEWFRALCDEHEFDLMTAPIVRTPSGGWHVYFRRPAGAKITNGRGSLPKKEACGIDIRGSGGYVLGAGGTIDIGVYELLDGPDIDAATEPPQWLLDILAEKRSATPVPVTPRIAPRTVTGREQAYAAKGLDDECATVASTPPGARNNQLNESAFKVGRMVGAGWLSFGEARAALAAAVGGWKDARKTLGTLDRALRAGIDDPREPLPADEHDEHASELASQIVAAHAPRYVERDGEIVDIETGEVEAASAGAAVDDDREFPEALMRPPGLVGDVMAWILATSRRPVPCLALGAALTIVGTAAGRQFAGPTRSGTHLYIAGLAPTSTGKEYPLQAIRRIMRAAGLSQHIGPDDFMSGSALNNTLAKKPLCLCPMDEFGAFISRVNAKKASTHERAISATMRKAWGASFGSMTTPAYAQSDAVEIQSPALSLFGPSNPDEFFRALEASDISNGFLNRFLLMSTSKRPEDRDPEADQGDVPKQISDKLRAIASHSGEMFMASLNVSTCSDPAVTITWASDRARGIYKDLVKKVIDIGDKKPQEADFYGRTAEMALRLATILAIGRSPFARVEETDISWGADVALWSARAMIRGAAEHMAENDYQASAQRVLKIIRDAGGRIRKRDLFRRMGHSIRMYDLEGIIKSLEAAEQVELLRNVMPASGVGRPSDWYRLTAD